MCISEVILQHPSKPTVKCTVKVKVVSASHNTQQRVLPS